MKKISKNKWDHVMDLIEACEDKYDSITKTPSDDPKWQEVLEICSTYNSKKPGTDPELQARIVEKVEEGRPVNYIASHLKISRSTVDKVISTYHLIKKPVFRYVVFKDDKPVYYCCRIVDLSKYFNKKEFNSFEESKNYLDSKGYELYCRNIVWKNIPVGCYYAAATHSKAVQKSSDSYQ